MSTSTLTKHARLMARKYSITKVANDFKALKWRPCTGGKAAFHKFPNGYGVSVVSHDSSYGGGIKGCMSLQL